MLRPGTVAGRDPVAMIACSNVERLWLPPALPVISSVCASRNEARALDVGDLALLRELAEPAGQLVDDLRP